MRCAAPFVLALLLAACARSEEASFVQPDSNQGYNRIGTVTTPDQDDGEPSIGEWRASLQEDRAALEFGPMGTEPLFSLLCTPEAGILLQRHGGAPAGQLPAMQASIGQVSERLQVTAGGGTIPMLRGEAPAGSPLFVAIATSAQPLTIRLDDSPPLILPPSPLVADYLRGCGRPQPAQSGNSAAPTTAPASPGNTAAPAPTPAANIAQPRN